MTIRYEAILVDNITPTLQKIKRETDSVKLGFAGLKSVLAGLTAALGTKELIDYTSRWTDLNSRFKNAIGDARGADDALKQIAQTARSTYSSLEATAETFLRNSQAMKELGFTTQQQVDFSDALNNALAVSGTKGAQAESVMNALSKAMALGKLSGENFNSVIANGGRIAQALADGLGVTTIQLRELAAAGRLDTITMVETLIGQMEKLRTESADMPVTARDGFVLLNNAIFEFIGRLDTAIGSSTNFGKLLEEVADAIISLARNADQMAKLAIVITEVGKAVGILLSVILGLKLVLPVLLAIKAGFVAIKGIAITLGAAIGGLASAFRLLPKALTTPLTRNNIISELKNFPTIGGKAKAVFEALGGKTEGLKKALTAVGLGSLAAKLGFNAFTNIQEKFEEQQKKTNGALEDSHVKLYEQERAAKAAREAFEKLKALKLAREFEDINTQLQLAARGYYENNKQQLDSLRTQNSLMNASAQQIKLSQSLTEAERAYLREKQRIDDALAKARVAASRDDEDARRKALASIPILEQQLRNLNSAYQDQGIEIKKLIEENEKLIRIKEFETFATQRQIDVEDQLQKIRDDINLLGLTETAKQYYNIEAAANASARAAIRAEEARRGEPLDPTEQQRYYAEASKGAEQLKQMQEKLTIESRKFSTGWKKATNEYVENATNAAKRAEDIFKKATAGMEDAIVNFAKTGKFEFRSFINSILEELLRSQIRQLMAQVFNIGGARGSGGGGGLFSGIGKILGFANGGIIPTNAPVLVGERGPELISGAAGRNVTPNSQLGLGTTNVIYNISAVDARSFKELVAADPSFIFAVTEQGRRTIPSARR